MTITRESLKARSGYCAYLRFINLVITLFCISFISIAQSGSIKGKISANGEPLAYASILVAGNNSGVISNDIGAFELKNIKPGLHEIVASGIGFQGKKLPVQVDAGAVTTINIVLTETISKLEDVVVTGVSRATKVRRSPIPIATVSKKDLDANVSSNIIDAIVMAVPGVSATSTGPNISKPFIRGLGYNRVLNMYDGIRQEGQQWGDEHGTEIDQYGIERVEVVKGPASLTYGSDAIAGVINMIPAVPKGVNKILKGDFLNDYHSNNGMVATSLGLSYSKDSWRYYLRGTNKRAHDYRNPVDGYVFGTGFREYNLSGTARVEKLWGYSQLSATLYDNKQEIPDGSRDSLTRKFSFPIYDDVRDDVKNRPTVPDARLQSYKVDNLHQRVQHYRIYTHNQLKVGEGDINGTLNFQQSRRREYLSPVNTSQAALFLVLNTINYDVRYNLPTFRDFETSFGINGMYQSNKNEDATSFPIPDYNLFDIGVFTFVKKSLGKLDLSGGLRYDARHLGWDDFYTSKDSATFGKWAYGSIGDSLQYPSYDRIYNGFSGSVGATYSLTEEILLKANFARGYRSPNINEVGANGLDPGAHIRYEGNRKFVPEFNFQKDVSFLAYLKNMDISLEIFDNNISNYIFQSRLSDPNGNPVLDPEGNMTYRYQQSKARLYGGELSFVLHPQRLKWLNFSNSLSYVRGLNKNAELTKQYGEAAKYLPFILPLHFRSELKGSVQKSFRFFSGLYAKTELDYYAKQDKIYAVDNTETSTPSYTLINIGAGCNIKSKSGRTAARLYLQVINLFDNPYQSHLNRLKYFEYYQASPTGRLGIYNMGRNINFKTIIPF